MKALFKEVTAGHLYRDTLINILFFSHMRFQTFAKLFKARRKVDESEIFVYNMFMIKR